MLSMYVYEYENEANDPLLQKTKFHWERAGAFAFAFVLIDGITSWY